MASRSLRKRALSVAWLTLATGAVVLGIAAAPASAGLGISCPDPATHPFAAWGDYDDYAFVPNGGFEYGWVGWTLSGGARVVPGNETFSVHGAGDAYSLSLPPGSSATTPPMCIALFSGHMRFFTANAGASSSRLRVQVLYGGGTGSLLGLVGKTLGLSDLGYVGSGAPWQPSPPVAMLGGQLPLLTQYVQFRFSPADSSGAWRIDDVYLDPLMFG